MKKRPYGRLEFAGSMLTGLGAYFLIFKEVTPFHSLILLSGLALSTFVKKGNRLGKQASARRCYNSRKDANRFSSLAPASVHKITFSLFTSFRITSHSLTHKHRKPFPKLINILRKALIVHIHLPQSRKCF